VRFSGCPGEKTTLISFHFFCSEKAELRSFAKASTPQICGGK